MEENNLPFVEINDKQGINHILNELQSRVDKFCPFILHFKEGYMPFTTVETLKYYIAGMIMMYDVIDDNPSYIDVERIENGK